MTLSQALALLGMLTDTVQGQRAQIEQLQAEIVRLTEGEPT